MQLVTNGVHGPPQSTCTSSVSDPGGGVGGWALKAVGHRFKIQNIKAHKLGEAAPDTIFLTP